MTHSGGQRKQHDDDIVLHERAIVAEDPLNPVPER
jgi:hypothetical protein